MSRPIWENNADLERQKRTRCRRLYLYIAVLSLIVMVFAAPGGSVSADEDAGDRQVEMPVLYYFWGHCPVCAKPEQHVSLIDHYPIEILVYEVFYDPANRALYDRFREELGIDLYGFPTIVFEGRYWLGFSDATQEELRAAIEASLQGEHGAGRTNITRLPIIGPVDLQATPIVLATVIISFLDGFNPCSLFVLTFLLAMIVHSASRRRIFIVGLTFLLVTAAVYGLFMLGILNIMVYASRLFWIRNVIALLVIIMGAVAVKDFFIFRKGISFSIPDSYKSKFYSQVRAIFYARSTAPMIAATALTALGIALVELPCTAGFPFAWSTMVSALDLSPWYFILLFLVYMLIYLSVELVIFITAVARMRTFKMTEERGRFLKLLAGSLMLILGLILLFAPGYMENILGLLMAFGAAALLMLAAYLLRKWMEGRNS